MEFLNAILLLISLLTCALECSPFPSQFLESSKRPLNHSNILLQEKSPAFYCDDLNDCVPILGLYSDCYESQCICNLGYQVQYGKCSPVTCTTNRICEKYFPNTECNVSRCVCDANSFKNVKSQECERIKLDSGSEIARIVGIGIGFAVFYAVIFFALRFKLQCQRNPVRVSPQRGTSPERRATPRRTVPQTRPASGQPETRITGSPSAEAAPQSPPPYSAENSSNFIFEAPPPYSEV